MATDEHRKKDEAPATNHGEARKQYIPPRLVEYGEVAKLTQSFTTVLE